MRSEERLSAIDVTNTSDDGLVHQLLTDRYPAATNLIYKPLWVRIGS
jgi:hypothetical protein